MFRVAMLSRWHPHAVENRYVRQLQTIPDTAIPCVWDEDPARGAQWAAELGVSFEPDLDRLLARPDVDGVCVTAPTDRHRDIIARSARAGKHVFTEKSLAMNAQEAAELRDIAAQAGIKLGIALPRRTDRAHQFAKRLYDSGALGTVALMRVRNAVTVNAEFAPHWFQPEPTGGGGAIRDLGCHNIDLACWILGEPIEAHAVGGFTRGFAVDDTGVCILKFRSGAIAELDSTFSAPLCINWYNIEIYGTKMAFFADPHNVTIIRADNERQKELIPVPLLPETPPTPLYQWVDACVHNRPCLCDADAGVRICAVMDALRCESKKDPLNC